MADLKGVQWLTSRAKRRQDVLLTVAMAPVALPTLGVAALAIRAVDRMPPLFIHERLGREHLPFTIFKLRTMPPDTAIASGGRHNDERRTALGKFLARIRADEAPQFLNILRGEMSVVGYRPLLAEEYEQARRQGHLTMDQFDDFMHMRSIAKPGLLHLMGIQNPHMEFDSIRESWQVRYESEREYFEKASSNYDWEIMFKSAKVAGELLTHRLAQGPIHESS